MCNEVQFFLNLIPSEAQGGRDDILLFIELR